MEVIDIYNEAADKWSTNKGVGTVLLCEPLSTMEFVQIVLDKMIVRNQNLAALIIVSDLIERTDMIHYLEEVSAYKSDFARLLSCKSISVLTLNYVENIQYQVNGSYHKDILITLNIKQFSGILRKYSSDNFKFKLLVADALDSSNTAAINMLRLAPRVYEINYAHLLNLSINSPVKEQQIGVDLTPVMEAEYTKLSNYISQSVTVFGSFKQLDECRVGNRELNLAAETCRLMVAENNGWNAHLDMSDLMCQQIDKMYSPTALYERANNTYTTIRERIAFVTECEAKLDAMLDIVKSNYGKKILIISKSGKFATKITDYLNANIKYTGKSISVDGNIFETSIDELRFEYCRNYHGDMQPDVARDMSGNIRVHKSGANKGKPIVIKAQAQRSNNLQLFNDDYVKVLSANNAIDTAFNALVDVVIFTSPLCMTLQELKYRLPNLQFSSSPNMVYKVFCRATIEEKKVNEYGGGKNYEIIKDTSLGFIVEE